MGRFETVLHSRKGCKLSNLGLFAGKSGSESCKHQGHSYCKQEKLDPATISERFKEFYADSSKQRQDQYVLNSIVLMPIKRRRVSIEHRKRKVQYNIHYYSM